MEETLNLAQCMDIIVQYRPFMHAQLIRKWKQWNVEDREEIIADFLLSSPSIVKNYNGSIPAKTYILNWFKYFVRYRFWKQRREMQIIYDSGICNRFLAPEEPDNSRTEDMVRLVLKASDEPELLRDRFLRNMTLREIAAVRKVSPERVRQIVNREMEKLREKLAEIGQRKHF